MTFTPFRVSRECPAKAAKAAKVGGSGVSAAETFAAFAAFAERATLTTDDDLAERGAIIAEGARVPHDWAEGFARLLAAPIPPTVAPATWRAMLDAAGRFLDAWGAKAAALGWSAGELFGLDPLAPLGRRDRRGAAFFLAGAEVVAITADAITVRIGGAIQNIRRRDGFTVPAWEVER
jgi:hypothetical protein